MFAQSSAEDLTAVRCKFQETVEAFVSTLSKTKEDPALLMDGSLARACESASTELSKLEVEMNSVAEMITKKEIRLTTLALDQKEKNELRGCLLGQLKEATSVKTDIATLEKRISSIATTDISGWKETYSSFEAVKGAPAATDKVASLINSTLASEAFSKFQTSKKSDMSLSKSSAPLPTPQIPETTATNKNSEDSEPTNQPGGIINSLGQKFVPISGLKVLFCIWPTRVRDYEKFIAETGRLWKEPGFPQGKDHPAVRVSYYDAQEFCLWLTEREHQSGTLPESHEYRLPTDFEWSIAAGIDEQESDDLPASKSGSVSQCYTWGTAWPPPRGSGNFDPKLKTDIYPFTSPVGSFAANRSGLFDMSGNTYQWMLEDYDESGQACARGGSWADEEEESINLTNRFPAPKETQGKCFGFRCVIAPED